MMCDLWYEDSVMGMDVEVCRKNNKRCTCSGVTEQCDYPEQKCKHYEKTTFMGSDVEYCKKKKIVDYSCKGNPERCNSKKQEEKVEEKREDPIEVRIQELGKQFNDLGDKIEQYKKAINQLAQQRISIQGGIVELKKMLPVKAETKEEVK